MLGKIQTCNSIQIENILCNENKIVKDLMNAFFNWHWIYKDSKSIKQKTFVDLFMTYNFKLFFLPF
jgi:hypothetical protein